jgi:hypothetical protein
VTHLLLRRSFLAIAGVTFLAPAFAAPPNPYITAIRAQLAKLPPGPVLLASYLVDPAGNTAFDKTQANTAYVYDNALAGLALHAAGFPDDALRIADALATAQAHDRHFNDGRLRNAYAAGAMSEPAKLPGFWNSATNQWDEDPYADGSATGPIAWAMILWTKLGMTAPATAAAEFLNKTLRAPTGYYGGFYGFDPAQIKQTWQSTEQNVDVYVAMRNMRRADDAAHAAAFVHAAFDPAAGVFMAGLGPTGERNPFLAADAGTWPYLAGLSGPAPAEAAIAQLRHGAGIGFSTASTGIWLEGTAFAALALRSGGKTLADAFLKTVAANVAPSGYIFATVAPELRTGLTVGPSLQPGVPDQKFKYFRRPALSATAWAAITTMHAFVLQ